MGPQAKVKRPDLLAKIKNTKTLGIAGWLIAIIIIASIISPSFLRVSNIINLIRMISINGIIAIGMTFVVLTGGVDLSVGSIVGVVAVSSAMLMQNGVPIVFTVIIALAIGALLGLINGLGVTKGGLAPFIMTLGTQMALAGVSLYMANGSPQSWRKTGIDFSFLGQGSLLGIPVPVYLYLIVFIAAFYVLKYTEFGRSVYAVGDSREAARLSGINTDRVEAMTFLITGFLSALSALILISRLSVGEPTAGEGYELDALAMVYIGGTATSGGSGGVVGTLVGAILISVLSNVLNLLGVSPFLQRVVNGLIIILAVLMEKRKKRK